MKVDFRNIKVKNVEGNIEIGDISKQLGNMLYMQGQDIEECELGHDIYHNGEVEINDKQKESIKRIISGYSYILRSAIEEAMA